MCVCVCVCVCLSVCLSVCLCACVCVCGGGGGGVLDRRGKERVRVCVYVCRWGENVRVCVCREGGRCTCVLCTFIFACVRARVCV